MEPLVIAARGGSQEAWDTLVERFAPLVWSICRRFDLSASDRDDVCQSVWLLLVEHLAELRQPAALPGWVATTTRRECLRAVQAARRRTQLERRSEQGSLTEDGFDDVERNIDRAIENAILRQALAELRPQCRHLLLRLFSAAKPSYVTIAAELDMKIGSIGPTRRRCLDELRQCPSFAAILHTDGAGGVADEGEAERGDDR
ncbi:sigma-70 family RNA polymerase sigma factor [Dactylosporangium sp. NPDC049525]|uniref:RNA polymerase sigma factor n=1 Tax=Dactylosporangium sp. NPDC049525 TaxID=3154730 RepID=UPI003424FD44